MIKKMSLGFCICLCMTAMGFPVFAGSVPDTGQTWSYTTTFGEDSDYTINPPSYTKLDSSGNPLPDSASSWAMVKDNVTGLIWEVKTDDGTINDKDNTYTWYDGSTGTPGDGTDTDDFINGLNSAHFGGYYDWRLPTIKELAYIVDYGALNPIINTSYFPYTMSSYYWSSTTLAYNTSAAWYINFALGSDGCLDKSSSYYVRAVRGGQSTNNFVDNENGTVTDTSTGLMWQKATAPGTYTWEQALIYAEGLVFPPGEYTDWRLPNIKELRSLADYSNYGPAISDKFPDTESSNYWSSTTYAYVAGDAWYIHFDNGGVSRGNGSIYVRAVRGGQGPLGMPWIPLLLLGK